MSRAYAHARRPPVLDIVRAGAEWIMAVPAVLMVIFWIAPQAATMSPVIGRLLVVLIFIALYPLFTFRLRELRGRQTRRRSRNVGRQ